jgi:hypothetical protein
MLPNPFAKRTRLDRARDGAEFATRAVREAAESVRDGADRVLAELPAQHRGRPPVVAVALVAGGAVATVVAARRLFGGDRSGEPVEGFPAPDVTPTAPSGPAREGLNDPALKAKVESELFQQEADVDKSRLSIGVADGVVTLRGELDSRERIESVAEAVSLIDGVRRVENLLHLPGEEPATVSGSA